MASCSFLQVEVGVAGGELFRCSRLKWEGLVVSCFIAPG